MTEDLERALRARKEFDIERDRRLEERFLAQERAVTLQLSEVRHRLAQMEDSHKKLIERLLLVGIAVLVVGVVIIFYLVTASPAN